jgi:hypothetical protein
MRLALASLAAMRSLLCSRVWWLLAVGACVACGGPPAAGPREARSLSPERARAVICAELQRAGLASAGSAEVEFGQGVPLEVDVGVQGNPWGIAYISEQEDARLGPSLPASSGSALMVVAAHHEQTPVQVLLLRAADYTYDDFAGVDRDSPADYAQKRLARDVRDFLARQTPGGPQ